MKFFGDTMHPNKEISETSSIWFFLALASLATALIIALGDWWQHPEIYVQGKNGLIRESMANETSLMPGLLPALFSVLFYISLLVRRIIRVISHPLALLLVAGDIVLIAIFIELILPAKGIKLLFWDISPMPLLIFVILFSWIGMRAIAGFGVLILIWASVVRLSAVNDALGLCGLLFVVLSFIALLLQMKLPYMRPEGGFLACLKQDFGFITHEARKDVAASGDAVKKTVAVALDAGNAAIAATVPVAGVATTAAVGKIKEGLLEGSNRESCSRPILKEQ